MRYELNFDEDKIIDIEATGNNSVFDLKDCCKIMNEQQSRIKELEEEKKYYLKKAFLFEKGIAISLQKEEQMKLYTYVDLEMKR